MPDAAARNATTVTTCATDHPETAATTRFATTRCGTCAAARKSLGMDKIPTADADALIAAALDIIGLLEAS